MKLSQEEKQIMVAACSYAMAVAPSPTMRYRFLGLRIKAQRGLEERDVQSVHLRKRKHRKLTDEFLSDVAVRYAELERTGKPPTATLAHQHRVTVGAVKHWMRQARQRGLAAAPRFSDGP